MGRLSLEKELPTPEEAKSLWIYDPTSGEFRMAHTRARFRAGTLVGSKSAKGYICLAFKGRLLRAHHVAWLLAHGRWPTGEIEHINGIRDDNRIVNLRERAPSRMRMALPREYCAWAEMKSRCSNPRHRIYRLYGGRGITVCERWQDSYDAFIADMGPRPSPDHSIDRIDNNGNYEPSNCRWATKAMQARNRSNARTTTHNGVKMKLCDIYEIAKPPMPIHIFSNRVSQLGWSVEKAISTPLQHRRRG